MELKQMMNSRTDSNTQVIRGIQLTRWLLLATLAWSACFAALAIWRPVSFDSLIAAADIYQLALGFALAAILLTCLKNSLNRYAVLGTSLAIISWTLGQLFWFSYTLLTQTPLPYPSVGDFGFTGTYFLLIGVLSVLEPGESKSKSSLLAFAILLAPLLLAVLAKSAPAVTLYNFVLGGASAWTVYKALPLRHAAKDRWLLGGILVLAATDIVFMTSVVLLRDSMTATTAPLYPIALSLIAHGILKREESTHA